MPLFSLKVFKMALNDTDIDICSRALLSIGAESITSFDDGSDEAKVAAGIYKTAKRDLLSIYPWTFNEAEVLMAQIRDTESVTKYKYLYEKPVDCLRARTVHDGARNALYKFNKGRINTDATPAILVYSYECDEQDMPTYFVSLLIDRLARDFIVPITGKHDERPMFDRIYRDNLAYAKSVDAQSKSASVLDTSRLTRVR